MNSLKYCGAVLKDWSEQPFFLELRQGELMIGVSDDYSLADVEFTSESDAEGTVFDGTPLRAEVLRFTTVLIGPF